LQADQAGGLFNPHASAQFTTDLNPLAAVVGRFTAGPNLDLAVLNQNSHDISIFLGDGKGGFAKTATVDAGNQPSGLALFDVNGDGKLDLLVGNEFGDVLVLLGNGDGTFKPYQRTSKHVALAVADLNHNGQDAFIYANQSLDRVVVQYAQPGLSFAQDRSNGVLAPGAVQVADLNGDGIPDLIVANSGSNQVFVYPGLGNGQFGPPQKFFTGTNPVNVTVADLNGDGIPDLVVANEGSNDVTVLLGKGTGANWTLVPGPRLNAHGIGPVSTAIRYRPNPQGGPSIPDILVANSQSNDVTLIPGVGGGFFDDRSRSIQTFQTGLDPQQVLVGNFLQANRLDLVSINSGSNDVTFFPGFQDQGLNILTGGEQPVEGVTTQQSGRTDLVVANNGDGVISLLTGEGESLTVAHVFSRADVPHPSSLALGSDPSVLYVTEEGEEAVARFTLEFGVALLLPPGQSPVAGQAPGERLPELSPLREDAVATVAILLTVPVDGGALGTANAGALEAEGGNALPGILSAFGAPVNRGALTNLGGGDEGEPDKQPEQGRTGAASGSATPGDAAGFESGLDETNLSRRLLSAPSPMQPAEKAPGGWLGSPIEAIDDLARWLMGHLSASPSPASRQQDGPAPQPAEFVLPGGVSEETGLNVLPPSELIARAMEPVASSLLDHVNEAPMLDASFATMVALLFSGLAVSTNRPDRALPEPSSSHGSRRRASAATAPGGS
jgi:hypothetical protein